MKGLTSLFLGIFGTFAFSWVGLILIPNMQIGHLSPQADEEGTDIYPMPPSGMVQRGRQVYASNGCAYCHSTQLRPDYISSDLERDRDHGDHVKWGQRRSAPRDYIFARPVLLGKERMGPDLANMGKAAPAEDEGANAAPAAGPAANAPAAGASPSPAAGAKSAANSSPSPAASNAPAASPSPAPSPAMVAAPATTGPKPYSTAWHHLHLYAPRVVSKDSNMPAYRFLYDERRISGERSSDSLDLTDSKAISQGWEVVPTYDAKCLVAYLMSLDQSHPLTEVKTGSAPSAPAAPVTPAAAASPAAAAPPVK